MAYAKFLAVNVFINRSLFSSEVINSCLQDIKSIYVDNQIYDNTIANEKLVDNYIVDNEMHVSTHMVVWHTEMINL